MLVSPIRTSSNCRRRLDHRADADHRPVLGAPGELLVAERPAVKRRQPHLGDQLVRRERGGEVVAEQVAARRSRARRSARAPRPIPRPRAAPPAGPTPGRRARASRRSCRGCAPAGRRSCRGRVRGQRRARRGPASSRVRGASLRSANSPFSARDTAQLVELAQMSTSSAGAARRTFISGSSECPPASGFASSPPSASARIASSTVSGAT